MAKITSEANAKTSLNSASAHFLKSTSQKLSELSDRSFCIGITGLSQSGKSTFITSLINQLLQHETSSLPGFSPVLNKRLLNVKMHPLEDLSLPTFPYDDAYKGLTRSEPQWPESTKDISGCLLELRLAKKVSKLNPFSGEQFSLFLEIRDYPGEWLLDLPLREMSYSRWCAQCNAQYNQPPRTELLGDLLEELQQLDPLAEVDEEKLNALNARFVEFLHECKKELSLIQPGRFLIPGVVKNTDVLRFIPLLKSSVRGQQNGSSQCRIDTHFVQYDG